jgi:hypothetical protein
MRYRCWLSSEWCGKNRLPVWPLYWSIRTPKKSGGKIYSLPVITKNFSQPDWCGWFVPLITAHKQIAVDAPLRESTLLRKADGANTLRRDKKLLARKQAGRYFRVSRWASSAPLFWKLKNIMNRNNWGTDQLQVSNERWTEWNYAIPTGCRPETVDFDMVWEMP